MKSIVTLPAAALALVLGASGFLTATTDAQSRVRVVVTPKRNTPAFYASRLKLCDDALADKSIKGGAYYRNSPNDFYIHARGFCLSDVNPVSWDRNYWRNYSYYWYGYGYHHHHHYRHWHRY